MTANRAKKLLLVVVNVAVSMLSVSASQAATAPIRAVLSSHFGWQVDKTTNANVCTVASKDECQPGVESSEAGGFWGPSSVAVDNDAASPEHGDVYVSDTRNQRVQVLSATGEFVLMFGWDVNKTKEEEGASQAERNVCTSASKDVCQIAQQGEAAGQFSSPKSIAVDAATGAVYVEDFFNSRIQVFTAAGEFVSTFGKEVNETEDNIPGATSEAKNLCTAVSGDKCKTGVRGTGEPAAFSFAQGPGSLLAVGGPEDLLYVGDTGRVQRFDGAGKSMGDITLSGTVSALTVDKAENMYIVYKIDGLRDRVIHKFNSKKEEIKDGRFPLTLSPRDPRAQGEELFVTAITVDSAGRLVVGESETIYETTPPFNVTRLSFGSLLNADEGDLIGQFRLPADGKGMGSSDSGELYAAIPSPNNELVAYRTVTVGDVKTGIAGCVPGHDHESNATFTCVLEGEGDPWGVPDTEVWFAWGETQVLDMATPSMGIPTEQPVEGVEEPPSPKCSTHPGEHKVNNEPKCPEAAVEGLRPNATFYYRLEGYDQNLKAPEEPLASGAPASISTPAVPPRIVGEPSVLFVTASSAVLVGRLNPENTTTSFFFEYGPCKQADGCLSEPYPTKTRRLEASTYGVVGATLEAGGLEPETQYHYRLAAVNAKGQPAALPEEDEGTFTTARTPLPGAETGSAGMIATTSAVISGTVDPDSQPTTYAFELGADSGAGTTYVVVSSGFAGSGAAVLNESETLTGLQPGSKYLYRIKATNGYGTVYGEGVPFTTLALPPVLPMPAELEQLPVPKLRFPRAVSKKLTRSERLMRALKACAKKPKSRRARCRRSAHKRYAVSHKALKRAALSPVRRGG
jgi:DNA-binding beta-propeller fold protein YncE